MNEAIVNDDVPVVFVNFLFHISKKKGLENRINTPRNWESFYDKNKPEKFVFLLFESLIMCIRIRPLPTLLEGATRSRVNITIRAKC